MYTMLAARMDSGWWYIMILESSNPSSFTDPRVRACGVTSKHHTASGRGVFQSTTPSQSVLNQLPSLCESRPHISQHRSFNASQRKSHPTSRRQPAPGTSPKGIPARDPHNSIHRLSNTVRRTILPAPAPPTPLSVIDYTPSAVVW